MAQNVIIMIGDGMGWEMARAAAVANGAPFYSSGKGEGLNFQTLSNYALATTYGTTIAKPNGTFSTGNGALDGTISATGDSPILPGFTFNPTFNSGNTATGGASNNSPNAVGNLVGYDPTRGGINPWTPGNDPQYIKWSYPDSANTATTLYTGVKSYNNAIGVDIYEDPLESVLVTANKQGKSTGLVTSVPIDHATPAAAAANVNRRSKYDDDFPALDNILQQELRVYQPTVLLGGGHPLSAPGDPLPEGVEPNVSNEFIRPSTYQELSSNPTSNRYDYTFLERNPDAAKSLAETAASLDPNKGDRLLGLYGARGQNGNLPVSSANGDYSTTGLDLFTLSSSNGQKRDRLRPLNPGETDEQFINRETSENPTLNDLTKASLDVLGKDPDGFWLMVEGGDVDWSAHDNNLDNLIGTVKDFDKSVKSTIDWIQEHGGWENNLLIVTADHDHYLTLNPNYSELLASKGAEALTDAANPSEAGQFWGSDPTVKYGWGNHSNRPVPVYYQGAGAEYLDQSIGMGYNSYGYNVPGLPGLVDQSQIYQAMYRSLTGATILSGTPTDDSIEGTADDNSIEGFGGRDTLSGGDGNDRLLGDQGDDVLIGGSGSDLLVGGRGVDGLDGGAGDDILRGGDGLDNLNGRGGADTFVFAPGEGTDVVFDFNLSEGDRIGLTGGLSFGQITLTQEGVNTSINAGNEVLAILTNFQANSLSSAAFVAA
jgi:alkaline phosphatase